MLRKPLEDGYFNALIHRKQITLIDTRTKIVNCGGSPIYLSTREYIEKAQGKHYHVGLELSSLWLKLKGIKQRKLEEPVFRLENREFDQSFEIPMEECLTESFEPIREITMYLASDRLKMIGPRTICFLL